jgi:O-antigen ligase
VVLITSLSITIRTPIGEGLIVPGQVVVGPAVLTITDLYLLSIAIGLVVYHRQIWIPKSSTVLALVGFAGAVLLSAIVNGLDLPAALEVIQWLEMGILMIAVGLLLRRDWERRFALRILVYIGTVRALWTLAYFFLNGYPGRRFDVLIEGAALVLLLGMVAHSGWTPFNLAQTLLLTAVVSIGQERKVWIAITGATVIMGIAYVLRTRDGYKVGLVLGKGALVITGLAIAVFLFILPPDIQQRVFTLIELVPGIGGRPQFERAYLVSTGLEMFRYNPIFGVGPENWFEAKSVYATDNLVAYEQRTSSNLSPHNVFIRILAETGLMGFTFLLFLFVRPLRFLGWYLSPRSTSTLHVALFGLFLFIIVVISFRGGGFINRAYLFLSFGFLLSYELNHPDFTQQERTNCETENVSS